MLTLALIALTIFLVVFIGLAVIIGGPMLFLLYGDVIVIAIIIYKIYKRKR